MAKKRKHPTPDDRAKVAETLRQIRDEVREVRRQLELRLEKR